MKTLKTIGLFVDRLIWAVGVFTIIGYTSEHWPLADQIFTIICLVAFGAWYFWGFFIQPFRQGLQGDPS